MMAPICSLSAVTVCHQAPDAHYFILIRIAAVVCKPARNSPRFFAKA